MNTLVWGALLANLTLAPGQPSPPLAPGGSSSSAPFSPYLNLLRPGSSPAINYYGLVRPEQQMRQQLGQLQQQFRDFPATLAPTNTEELAPAGNQLLTPTGHSFRFNSTGSYFNRLNGGAGVPSVARGLPMAGPNMGQPNRPAGGRTIR
jgi:hypothetical protein